MSPKRVSLADRAAHDTAKSHTALETPAVPPVASALWSEEIARREVVALDVNYIMPNRRQPRTILDQVALEELAASIREHGVIQPIIVRPIPLTKWEGHARRYELIAGERRWRASILIENLHRADLHPLEEAWAFDVMRDELGYSYRQIAERVGRSKGYVQNRLQLLDLADDLQQLVLARPDTLMHVVEIAKVPDPAARADLIAAVRDDALSYTETQTRVRVLLAPPATSGTADEVYLHKYIHDRQTDGDHGTAAAGERQAQPAQASTVHDRLPKCFQVVLAVDMFPLACRSGRGGWGGEGLLPQNLSGSI